MTATDHVELRRHALVTLSDAAWQSVLSAKRSPVEQGCLAHWAAHHLPLVVTRQTGSDVDDVALGLPAPSRWERRRLALRVARSELRSHAGFPDPLDIASWLEPGRRWRQLLERVRPLSGALQVYGGFGWQCLSGLDYVHADSDIDLLMPVSTPDDADAIADRLIDADIARRIDGEFVFDDGAAVAWREWHRARSGGASTVLVKRLNGVALEPLDARERSPC